MTHADDPALTLRVASLPGRCLSVLGQVSPQSCSGLFSVAFEEAEVWTFLTLGKGGEQKTVPGGGGGGPRGPGAGAAAGGPGKGRGRGLRGRLGRGARDCPMLCTPRALNAPLTRLL